MKLLKMFYKEFKLADLNRNFLNYVVRLLLFKNVTQIIKYRLNQKES